MAPSNPRGLTSLWHMQNINLCPFCNVLWDLGIKKKTPGQRKKPICSWKLTICYFEFCRARQGGKSLRVGKHYYTGFIEWIRSFSQNLSPHAGIADLCQELDLWGFTLEGRLFSERFFTTGQPCLCEMTALTARVLQNVYSLDFRYLRTRLRSVILRKPSTVTDSVGLETPARCLRLGFPLSSILIQLIALIPGFRNKDLEL